MKKRLIFLIVMFFLFFLSDGYSFLKSRGKDLVDSTGQAVLLRGIGLGGWLVQEGYQLHIPGFGSPSSIRQMIIELVGEENANLFYQQYLANYVTETDIQQIAGWGFNSIRLPFNYRLVSPEDQPGVYLEEGFEIFDRVLEWCKKYHLYLILDMHCAPGGQNKDNISDSDGIEARLWTEQGNQDRLVEIWKTIARRYAGEKMIAGYDLINEPVLPPGYPNTTLRALLMRLTRAIREVDPNHVIFIEGNWYATDFSHLTPPWDQNLVYSFHKYWNENTLQTIQSYLWIRDQYNVPLWLGESGENSNPWFYDCVRLMEENHIGWCWWTHKKVATTTSPYSAPIGPNYQRVLDYWNGLVARPSPSVATTGLLEMAENLKLAHCEFRPGVVKALLDPAFTAQSIPFIEHVIPGMINAVDYDIGNQNCAYSDRDFQNTGGLGAVQWNKGGEYRNDGVDIEKSGDSSGAPYDVGWIEDGEWLLYSVHVASNGSYRVDFRVSSPYNSGRLQLFLNELTVSNIISVPNTGGWKNWRTLSTTGIYLPEGDHFLKVLFLHGGFNLNLIRFQRVTTKIEERYSVAHSRKTEKLLQNYPNPFNRNTVIPIFLSRPGRVRLRIYTSRGALVKQLLLEEISAGSFRILWDGTDGRNQPVSSGHYFYQLDINGDLQTKSMILQR